MDDNQNQNAEDAQRKKQPEIIVNEYGTTKDSAVVVEEENRTVLLTDDETIIIEKQETIDLAPKNRPRKVYAGMWGPLEIATAGLGLMAVLTAILLFVFIVIPSEKQLEANRDKRDKLDTELTSTKKKYDSITNTEAEAAKLVESVQDFETRFLRPPSIGQTAIYQRINGLINAYGLTNTTGPDYIPLEIANQGGSRGGDAERGREKFQSLFPGVYITMTVEGSYQNLRRFIREIETGEQFIVISAIELEPSEKDDRQQNEAQTIQARINNAEVQALDEFGNPTGQSVQAAAIQNNSAPQSSRGRVRGQTVNLTIEMAAYFRRPDFQPIQPINTAQ